MATDGDKRLLKRIVISQWDLGQARDCIAEILDRRLHESREDRALWKGMNTAFIVAYCRPFTKNYDQGDSEHPALPTLPKEYLDVLTDDQRQVHNALKRARDQDQAHSDEEATTVTVRVSDTGLAVPSGRNPLAPWTPDELQKAKGVIEALYEKLDEESQRIVQTLDPGDCF